MAAFRLPSGCIKEIEKICSAFLWSDPDLNGKKAKISWGEVCKMKQEGGLGLRPLKEVNQVCCLKLIWRILSAHSLWVNWIKIYLIRKGSIWMIKDNTQSGSWMWRKILKNIEKAKKFYGVEVHDGKTTSFWYEAWSTMGCLKDIVREGSVIDMDIPVNATLEESMNHRRRRHRVPILNRIELEIDKFKENWTREEDVSMWKNEKGKFKNKFSTKETWLSIREKHIPCDWYKAVRFKHATPRFAFITWVAMHGRLATGDRMKSWNITVDASCVLCQEPLESTTHLFFECAYSAQVWKALMKGILQDQYSVNWENLIRLVTGRQSWDKTKIFTVRYAIQLVIYSIWRERNRRRHGELAVPASVLSQRLDKAMRNQFYVIRRRGDVSYEDGMTKWFETR